MSSATPLDPNGRDRAIRRVRSAARLVALAAAGATATLSVVAAHAFKGHDGRKASTTAKPVRTRTVPAAPKAIEVPPPQQVPAISGAPAPLAAPSTPPASAPPPPPPEPAPAPAPAPETSGGS